MTRATDHGFITEAEVIETWPMIPAPDIRRARRNGDIPFYQFPGGPHYRRQDIEAFIERKYRRGPTAASMADARPEPEPIGSKPVAPTDTFSPAQPVSLRPEAYETMAEEEKRIQQEALAKRRQGKATHAAPPIVTGAAPTTPLPDRPETREEEIDRLRAEVFAERIMSRRPAARRQAAAVKAAKPEGKARRITPKPDRP